MTENVTNELLLENLKVMRGEFAVMRDDIAEIKIDIRGLKIHMTGFMQSELAQDSAIVSIKERLGRIERRLELSE